MNYALSAGVFHFNLSAVAIIAKTSNTCEHCYGSTPNAHSTKFAEYSPSNAYSKHQSLRAQIATRWRDIFKPISSMLLDYY